MKRHLHCTAGVERSHTPPLLPACQPASVHGPEPDHKAGRYFRDCHLVVVLGAASDVILRHLSVDRVFARPVPLDLTSVPEYPTPCRALLALGYGDRTERPGLQQVGEGWLDAMLGRLPRPLRPHSWWFVYGDCPLPSALRYSRAVMSHVVFSKMCIPTVARAQVSESHVSCTGSSDSQIEGRALASKKGRRDVSLGGEGRQIC